MTNCGGQVQRLQRALLAPGEAKSDLDILVGLARACGALSWMHVPWSSILKEIAAVNPGYAGVTPQTLLEGGIPQTTLAASGTALPDLADLNALAESIRFNRSRSLYASGSLALHSHILVQLEPRAAVQEAFVETYQM